MPRKELDSLIGRASISDKFREQLLNKETRKAALDQFIKSIPLTETEVQMLLKTRGTKLRTFSDAVSRFIEKNYPKG